MTAPQATPGDPEMRVRGGETDAEGLGLGCDALTDGQQVSGVLLSHQRTPRRPNPSLPSASSFNKKARARFWMKVSPAPADACWLWHGARGASGYGNFGANRKTYLAHRVAYEIGHGPIPPGLDIDHTCRNKQCVNPSHLEAVTFLANMRRRYAESPDERETHCLRGHELTLDNTRWVQASGQRICRRCQERSAS